MSLGQAKTIVNSLLKNMKPVVFLVFFTYLVALAPQKFAVLADTTATKRDVVRAAYEQMLLESTKNNAEGSSIAFDTMIVDVDNGESAITYTIAPGDTLASIAAQFGTTVEALLETNEIPKPNALSPGKKLVISYTEGVPYIMASTQTVEDFSRKYNLNQDDFMALNYFESSDTLLEEGRQVILPLNELEAERKELLPKEDFVMLALEDKQEENNQPEEYTVPVEQPEFVEPEPEESTPGQDSGYAQTIITAEETQQRLATLQQQQEEQEKVQKELAAAIPQPTQQAPEEPKPQAPAPQEAQADNPCKDTQCYFQGECRTKPVNSTCSSDRKNAWSCLEGYTEKNSTCVALPKPQAPAAQVAVTQPVPEAKPVQQVVEKTIPEPQPAPAPVVAKGERKILAQWYSNYATYDDFVPSGFARGHCTEAAAYFRYKDHGINIRTAWKGGNAGERLGRAKKAGYVVNDSPEVGAIIITNYSRFGHAGYVTAVDRDNGMVTIIDQNYVGRHITTEQVIPMTEALGFIHPYKE